MILIGNSFPFSLIRRRVEIEPVSLDVLTRHLSGGEEVVSFWGHANTLAAAEALTGCSLKPETERPSLDLSPNNLPVFQGRTFEECWILSPQYINNFRPKVGEEVSAEKIEAWQVLRIRW